MSQSHSESSSGTSTLTIIVIIGVVLSVLGLLVCGGLVGLLLPAIQAARDTARRIQDSNNLRVVGIGLLNYEYNFQSFPPPVTVNSEGKPVWSWAVSILPFIEESRRYDSIQEAAFQSNMPPWDSPVYGEQFKGPAPSAFTSSRSATPKSNHSNIFLISVPPPKDSDQPVPMFVDGTSTQLREVIDGTAYTIMAIQLTRHSVPWASPITLSPDEAFRLIRNEPGFVNVLMADSMVIAIPSNIDRATFDAMVTRNGKEIVDLTNFRLQ